VTALVFLAVLLIVFWLLVVLPQRRRRQQQAQLLADLQPGDEVLTIGGILGRVRELEDEVVVLEIAPDTAVRVAKSAVTGRKETQLEHSKTADAPLP
jgi:preprotein translocase subunit YajC